MSENTPLTFVGFIAIAFVLALIAVTCGSELNERVGKVSLIPKADNMESHRNSICARVVADCAARAMRASACSNAEDP